MQATLCLCDSKPIEAHGEGVLYDERTETYFWYGENKYGKTYRAHTKGADRVSSLFSAALSFCHHLCAKELQWHLLVGNMHYVLYSKCTSS